MKINNYLPLAFASLASAQSLTEALSSQNATLSSLTALLGTQESLLQALSAATNITILAPSNDALATFLNSTAGQAAATDPGAVAALLTYHVLNGTYPPSAFTNASQFLPSLLSNTSYANVTGGQVVKGMLNGTGVALTSGLLAQSSVLPAVLNFTGGVIHIIDTVLTVPQSPSGTAVAANLTSIAGALSAANLVSTVDSLKDVTIFAPSNAAFSDISSALGNASTEALTNILTYHVVQGVVGYSSILTNTTLKTVNGGSVTISIIDGTVFVNSAKVILPDVLVSNGVVHVIDGVLNPDNASAAPNPTTTSVAFPGASSAASDIPFTSNAPTPSATISSSVVNAATSGTSTAGGGRAVETGVMGLGALFGVAALVMA